MVKLKIEASFPVSPRIIYEAWIDSNKHSAMTGGTAQCSDATSEPFTAWDGYISGINIKLTPYSEIIQNWRTSEFSDDQEDSILTIKLEDHENGCLLTLEHSNIPDGQSDYEQGWHEHYFKPMKEYFN